MVSINSFRKMSLSLPEVSESLHFEKPSFRIKNKILATLHVADKKVVLKLSLVEQSVFADTDRSAIYPVPGGWGKQGYSFVELSKIKKTILKEALECAWKNTAPASFLKKYVKDGVLVSFNTEPL
jgi:hypothetical protein